MHQELSASSFELVPYRDSETHVLSGTDDLLSLLDEQRITVQLMLTSPLIAQFEVGLGSGRGLEKGGRACLMVVGVGVGRSVSSRFPFRCV